MKPLDYTSSDNDFNSILRIDVKGYPQFPNGVITALEEFRKEGREDRIVIAKLAINYLKSSLEVDKLKSQLKTVRKELEEL